MARRLSGLKAPPFAQRAHVDDVEAQALEPPGDVVFGGSVVSGKGQCRLFSVT
ncbi:hypothetical protein [Streptomyces sp. NPDC046870]|uniref:hypothetical protein n=1 Tax=Streptomyces sp. NPDC046870 TaxID=3155135 RepID=UPI003452117B